MPAVLNAADYDELDTPCVVIDEAVALRNIAAHQSHCDAAGIAARPHIKTHKLVHFARAQVAAGAVGITAQKIGEAEVMAAAGLDDILITFNIVGDQKLRRLRALAATLRRLAVTVDSAATVAGLGRAFAEAERPLDVLVECDTGAGRCGVGSPQAATDLARIIAGTEGLRFQGLMTFPAPGGALPARSFMAEALEQLRAAGIACPVVSTGGSPDMWQDADPLFTEYRAGTYIYNDKSLVTRGNCGWDDCAAGVLATVVSTPAPGRAVIDAGSKTLTSDLFGMTGHGHVLGSADTRIVALSEEHGVMHHGVGDRYHVGQRLMVIPNHVCPVINLFDAVWLKGTDGLRLMPVDARGKVA